MLFKALDRMRRNAIMAAIVLMFAGNVLLVVPYHYTPFLGGAAGFALAVYSLVSIFDFVAGGKALIDCIRLFVGLLAGVIGIMLFVFDGLFVDMMSVLVGVVPIVAGAIGLYHAFAYARRSGRRGWWVLVVLSGAIMVFGGFVFFNPWMDSPQAAMQIVGGVLMYTAILSALSLIWLWPARSVEEA